MKILEWTSEEKRLLPGIGDVYQGRIFPMMQDSKAQSLIDQKLAKEVKTKKQITQGKEAKNRHE